MARYAYIGCRECKTGIRVSCLNCGEDESFEKMICINDPNNHNGDDEAFLFECGICGGITGYEADKLCDCGFQKKSCWEVVYRDKNSSENRIALNKRRFGCIMQLFFIVLVIVILYIIPKILT